MIMVNIGYFADDHMYRPLSGEVGLITEYHNLNIDHCEHYYRCVFVDETTTMRQVEDAIASIEAWTRTDTLKHPYMFYMGKGDRSMVSEDATILKFMEISENTGEESVLRVNWPSEPCIPDVKNDMFQNHLPTAEDVEQHYYERLCTIR